MLLYGDVKSTLTQASDGGCDPAQVIERVNEAIPLLMGKMFFVGTVAEIKIQTFVPEFSLPFGYERALSVIQCESGDFNQGWYSIENSAAYIDPAQWGDSVAIDLGMKATERALLGPAKIIVQSDYNEDFDLKLRLYGSLGGNTNSVYVESEGRFFPQNYEELPIGPDNSDKSTSVNFYDLVSALRKPVTKGPVRVLALDQNSGRLYRLITLQPNETDAQRRWYKYPELQLTKIVPRCVYPTDEGFQIDTNFEQVPLCAGDSIVLSGFCPTQFNGLWTVANVVGTSFYVVAPIKANWTNPGEAISKIGCCTKLACMTVSASKDFVPIVDDNSEVIIQNRLALRMTIRALWAWDTGDVDGAQGFTTLLAQAVAMLTEDLTRYGADPTNTLNRKAAYRFEHDNYAPSTFGYIRARLALEIVNGLRYGRSDLGRLLNEAQELSIVSGKYGNTAVERVFEVTDDRKIVLDPDCESVLTASLNSVNGRSFAGGGGEIIIGDKYWRSTTNMQPGRGMGYGGQPYFALSTLGGAGFLKPTLVPCEEEERDEQGRCCKVFRLEPCGHFCGCCFTAVVKLRYLEAVCLKDHLLITNFAALKFIVEGLIKREAGDFESYQKLKNAGFALLDVEIRHKKGGAQGKVRRPGWALIRRTQGMR
jgi:hypothetical protein